MRACSRRNGTRLLAGLVGLLIVPAPARSRTQDALAELTRPGAYPRILGMAGEHARAFAAGAPADVASRRGAWELLEHMLGGGGLDPGGERIREVLPRLPPSEWYFLVAVERERRRIVSELGRGGLTNAADNAADWANDACEFAGLGKPFSTKGYRCYDRRDRLARAVDEIRVRGVGKQWSHVFIQANPGAKPSPVEPRSGEHHANCLVYLDGNARVEIMADAWGDSLVPAYTWWWFWERDVHDALKASGQEGWCEPVNIREGRDAARQASALKQEELERSRRSALNLLAPGLSP
ncbi:MAG: hypothetical protein HY553_23165 [Elusimicrobia bacterium]|nr:hypothetical protein [Elusimicrobiota bacterium]